MVFPVYVVFFPAPAGNATFPIYLALLWPVGFVATSALGDSLIATSALDDSLFATSALDDSLFATSDRT